MDIKDYLMREMKALSRYDEMKKQRKDFDLERIIDVFLGVLNCKVDAYNNENAPELIQKALKSLIEESNSVENLDIAAKVINSTENYSKIVLWIVNPKLYDKEDIGNKTYSPAVKKVVDRELIKEDDISNFLERRNEIHNSPDLSIIQQYIVIHELLFDYILITYFNLDKLEEYIANNKANKDGLLVDYCTNIINEYEKENLDYIDVHWIDESDERINANIDIINKVIKKGSVFHIKFFGEAGTGKTTALKRIQYLKAKQYLSGECMMVPILVPLYKTGKEHSVYNCARNILNIDDENMKRMLNMGNILLLLDGYNEVLKTKDLNAIATEIDRELVKDYSKATIILSDRTLGRDRIPVLTEGTTNLTLEKISIAQKKDYFKNHLKEELYNLVEIDINKRPAFYEQRLDTPFKLQQFVEVVNENNEISDNYIELYLQNLIRREHEKNKEEDMRHMEDYLKGLSLYFYDKKEKTYGRVEILRALTTIKEKLGFNTDTERLLDIAQEMHILKIEDEGISFYNEEYLKYYIFKAGIEGYDRIWS